MLLIESVAGLQEYLDQERLKGHRVGFVPTMGALHDGHISLIEQSKNENDLTVCSIFINPKQFNDQTDLANYPKDKDGDMNLLESANCDVLFYPDVKEIYPNEDLNPVSLGSLEKVLEGKYRPGHFAGVSIVVRRFLEIIQPDKAYFGLKDFQQFVVVKTMCRKLGLDVEIIGCDTKREHDGLAMSSRNSLLTENGRKDAVIFYNSLLKSKRLVEKESFSDISESIKEDFAASENCALEYFEMVDYDSLETVNHKENHASIIACIAGYVDGVRLIDNLILIP